MIGEQTVLGLIPARGGSKGVRRKNLRQVGAKPLIAWTIEAAQAARTIDAVVLSSDDPEIIETARRLGCAAPFVRPAELAADTTETLPVVRHALGMLDRRFDLVVLLQPTSPLRTGADIDAAVALFARSGADSCVSVCLVDKTPWWMYRLGQGNVMIPLLEGPIPARRQDAPPVYALNGAVYVARSADLLAGRGFVLDNTVAYVMPKERSLDIDSELDLRTMDMIISESRP